MSNQFQPSGFSYLPLVVKNLLIINGLFFIATILGESTFHTDLSEILGLHIIGTSHFKPYQFVTHLFMHGSFMHLFSNMFALWMFGTAMENFWGPKHFLIYYIVTGLGAALLHSLIGYYQINHLQHAIATYSSDPTLSNFQNFVYNDVPSNFKSTFVQLIDSWSASGANDDAYVKNSTALAQQLYDIKANITTVGASGAVFGVLLAFGMTFPNSLIYVFFAIPIKAKYFVALYGLWELYDGLANNPGDNVAHFAHLGGMLFGFFLIRYWNKQRPHTFW